MNEISFGRWYKLKTPGETYAMLVPTGFALKAVEYIEVGEEITGSVSLTFVPCAHKEACTFIRNAKE